jgi:ATP-binding cassette subfamily B protein
VVLLLVAQLTGAQAMSLGTAYVVFAYVQRMQEPLIALSHQMQDFQRAVAGLSRVRALLALEREDPGGAAELPRSGPLSVRFDEVTFGYEPERPTLHGVSFAVPAGGSLGIVGQTGSGKTTIARLLVGLHRRQAGRIEIGARTIDEVRLASLRERVAMVTQEVLVLGGTVRDNVTLFDADISDADVLAAIEALGLRPWYDALPDGLDTRVGDDAGRLSAGQAQLLALTRVFVRNHGVLLLDEASARLDPQTEELLDRALAPLLRDRTTVIIAHRLSTLRHVDEILVLDDGRVVEYGPRAELLADVGSRFTAMQAASR